MEEIVSPAGHLLPAKQASCTENGLQRFKLLGKGTHENSQRNQAIVYMFSTNRQ